jgi:hypothetical protein
LDAVFLELQIQIRVGRNHWNPNARGGTMSPG